MKQTMIISLLGIISIAGVMLYQQSKYQPNGFTQTTPAPTTEILGSVQGESSYTLAEVAEHDGPESCWLVISDKVYDVTEFIAEHPGGDKLLPGCGIDATSVFHENAGK